MGNERFPATPAVRELKESGVPYTLHAYDYEEKGFWQNCLRSI